MSAGVLGLFGVAMGAALIELLLPGEEKSGVRQAVRLLSALIVLCLLLSPLASMLGSADDFLQREIVLPDGESEACFGERFEEAIEQRSMAEFKELLLQYLYEEHGVEKEDCEVEVTLSEDGELALVRVRLSGAALLRDPEEIEAGLREKLDCCVEVR